MVKKFRQELRRSTCKHLHPLVLYKVKSYVMSSSCEMSHTLLILRGHVLSGSLRLVYFCFRTDGRLLLLAANLGWLPQSSGHPMGGNPQESSLGAHLRFPLRSFCSGERMESETSEQPWYFRRELGTLLPPTSTPTLLPPQSFYGFHIRQAIFARPAFSSEGTSEA